MQYLANNPELLGPVIVLLSGALISLVSLVCGGDTWTP